MKKLLSQIRKLRAHPPKLMVGNMQKQILVVREMTGQTGIIRQSRMLSR